ncbi:NAD(P)/FAD-dependent oxidoreductase [Arthrobacter rhizosphaerae]|uniref:NAD(P)/FAD-dependent oxidoreductase n=1 Tax=Arthrobacter rhizosphaerae TaxID=2855490 RepID=UPI001FF64610|nr:FAD-binding oxidoreductase [Arthrobacter rhizosphaerae]
MHTKHVDNVVPLVRSPECALPAAGNVVILGGGIMGTSIAFHLAEAGVNNIVLVERHALGSGSSAKPLGGVRATFSDPGNIKLGQRSLEAYERFGEKFKTDIGLRQVGYLFLCRNEAELLQVANSTHIQNRLGGSSRMVSPYQAHQINPFIDPLALIAASYSPRDGFAQPSKVVRAYAEAAQQLGVTICQDTEVLDIDASGGEIRALYTNRGSIRTSTVICAAGAWSTRLGAMAGVHLPIEPVRRQIGMTPQGAKPFPSVPFTLDLSTTLYFHNYLNGMLLGISNQDQEPGFCREFDYQWLPAFNAAAEVVAPSLANRELEVGWAGLYENTPDHNAMIGSSDTVHGFMYATGFSGHGFLQGPAVGELIRDMYLGRQSFMDPTHFSAARFAGELTRVREVHII